MVSNLEGCAEDKRWRETVAERYTPQAASGGGVIVLKENSPFPRPELSFLLRWLGTRLGSVAMARTELNRLLGKLQLQAPSSRVELRSWVIMMHDIRITLILQKPSRLYGNKDQR